jgi:hypothetical protein
VVSAAGSEVINRVDVGSVRIAVELESGVGRRDDRLRQTSETIAAATLLLEEATVTGPGAALKGVLEANHAGNGLDGGDDRGRRGIVAEQGGELDAGEGDLFGKGGIGGGVEGRAGVRVEHTGVAAGDPFERGQQAEVGGAVDAAGSGLIATAVAVFPEDGAAGEGMEASVGLHDGRVGGGCTGWGTGWRE